MEKLAQHAEYPDDCVKFRARAFGYIFERVISATDCGREQNECEPDVIQHA